jgi:pSer/pThr/pTyr-binding forkhead associated (FHA) protein
MNFKLIVVQGKPVGKSLLFALGEYYFGRGPECHVRFNSDWVSRQHCLLKVEDSAALLRDLASRNGTLVNGRLLQNEGALQQGDQVQIGPVVFEVRFEDPTPADPVTDSGTFLPGDTDEQGREPSSGSTARHPSSYEPE